MESRQVLFPRTDSTDYTSSNSETPNTSTPMGSIWGSANVADFLLPSSSISFLESSDDSVINTFAHNESSLFPEWQSFHTAWNSPVPSMAIQPAASLNNTGSSHSELIIRDIVNSSSPREGSDFYTYFRNLPDVTSKQQVAKSRFNQPCRFHLNQDDRPSHEMEVENHVLLMFSREHGDYCEQMKEAVQQHQQQRVYQLLDQNCIDVNSLIPYSERYLGYACWTALDFACEKGHTDLVKYFLSRGAYVESNIKSGMYFREKSALMVAAEHGWLDIAVLLLEHGADVNYCNILHGTVLQVAALYQHEAMVGLLLSFGANADHVEEVVALSNGPAEDDVTQLVHKGVLNHILRKTSRPSKTIDFSFSLQAMVNCLLRHGADLQAVDQNGNSVLLNACMQQQENIAMELLHRGASFSSEADWHRALQYAIKYHMAALTNLLMLQSEEMSSAGICSLTMSMLNVLSDVSIHRNVCSTKTLLTLFPALMSFGDDIEQIVLQVCKLGYVDILEVFLDHAFPVQSVLERDSVGLVGSRSLSDMDVMSVACKYGRVDIVKKLLDRGVVSVQSMLSCGLTAMQIAILEDKIVLAEFLRQYGGCVHDRLPSGNSLLYSLAKQGNSVDCLEFLLRHGVDVNDANNDKKQTALLGSVANHHLFLQTIETLLSADNIDVNAQDEHGWNALMYACFHDYCEVAELLVKKQANFSLCNEKGETVLGMATAYNRVEFIAIVLGQKKKRRIRPSYSFDD